MYDLAFALMDEQANPIRYSMDEVIKMIEES